MLSFIRAEAIADPTDEDAATGDRAASSTDAADADAPAPKRDVPPEKAAPRDSAQFLGVRAAIGWWLRLSEPIARLTTRTVLMTARAFETSATPGPKDKKASSTSAPPGPVQAPLTAEELSTLRHLQVSLAEVASELAESGPHVAEEGEGTEDASHSAGSAAAANEGLDDATWADGKRETSAGLPDAMILDAPLRQALREHARVCSNSLGNSMLAESTGKAPPPPGTAVKVSVIPLPAVRQFATLFLQVLFAPSRARCACSRSDPHRSTQAREQLCTWLDAKVRSHFALSQECVFSCVFCSLFGRRHGSRNGRVDMSGVQVHETRRAPAGRAVPID